MKKALIMVTGILAVALIIESLVLASAINNNQKLKNLFEETSGDKDSITDKFLQLENEKESLESEIENKIKESNEKYKFVSNICKKTECLFENEEKKELVGLAELEGYYQEIDKETLGVEKEQCNSFVVTGGNKNLIDHFKKLVKEKNTINSINEKDNLVINLNLENLSKAEQNFIKNSDEKGKVSLSLIRETTLATGAPTCFSFVDIIDMNEVEVE